MLRFYARGGLDENVIAECLIKRGYKLYYYKPDDNHELEFFIEKEGSVIPTEVKAGNTATLYGYVCIIKQAQISARILTTTS